MKYRRHIENVLPVALMAALLALAGCGGGGETGGNAGSPPQAGSVTALAWDPPRTFVDNTALDPYRDLDYYEIYLRSDQNFTDNDVEVAQVAAVTDIVKPDGNTVKTLTTEFDLVHLAPFAGQGTNYYLSVKAVGTDKSKSDYSEPVRWDLENNV